MRWYIAVSWCAALFWTQLLSQGTIHPRRPLPAPLRLPPGLSQVLPLNPNLSYFGDAVRIVHCPADEDNPLGTCGNLLFGGFALFASPLSGFVEVTFYPPVNNIAHFEITHPGNLVGRNAVMKAPQFYEVPVTDNFVLDPLGRVSSGDLNLITGEVTNLEYQVLFFNSFYNSLLAANPLLRAPAFVFPGIYGSAELVFGQRADGLLDMSFVGSSFIPLGNNISGDPVRIPTPFTGPLLDGATIQAPGSSLHPRIYLTTREDDPAKCGEDCPELPLNSIQEYTVFTKVTSFGDRFLLNVPQLGGEADGRAHLQGRLQIQFGERTGDIVPVAIACLVPGGLLAEPPEIPPPLNLFPPALLGHDELLIFPRLTYVTADVLLLEDQFDLAMGAVDVSTGRFLGPLLYRGVPAQTLLSAIIDRNVPRIPLDTFRFRGPAAFEKGTDGQTVFRYDGEIFLIFEDFTFPTPDYGNPAVGFITGPGSVLNPFFKVQAMRVADPHDVVKRSSGDNITSSFQERFSYQFEIPCDPTERSSSFEFTNHTRGGTFTMDRLASVSCINSRSSKAAPGDYDTVTFTGFGSWSGDPEGEETIRAASVQAHLDAEEPYISILIDGGLTDNVNTKPSLEPTP
jgi:hypothetical protein